MKNHSAKEKILSCSEDESKVSHHTKCICYNYSLRIDELHALFSKRKQHEQNGESVVRLVRTVIWSIHEESMWMIISPHDG